jgi:hypothetical protein
MCRSGVVDRRGDPSRDCRHHVKTLGNSCVWYRQLVRRLTGAHVMQPDDFTVTVIQLRRVVVVHSELVRFQVSVRDRMRVAGVRFVQMLWRNRCRQGDKRRQNETHEYPAQRRWHAR